MEQVCASCLPTLSTVDDLHVYLDPVGGPYCQVNVKDAMARIITLICRCEESLPIEEIASHIVPVLQELEPSGPIQDHGIIQLGRLPCDRSPVTL